MVKIKQPPIYDPNGEITAFQIQRIRQLCGFNEKEKARWVLQVTNGASSSLKLLKQHQAITIIKSLTGQPTTEPKQVDDNWAIFDKFNDQHRYILSLLIQMGWSTASEKYGEVADLYRLSNWLKSEKSPVRKPLKSMSPTETSTIIAALESMNGKYHSK